MTHFCNHFTTAGAPTERPLGGPPLRSSTMRAWCVDNGFHSTLLRQLPTVAIIGLRTTSLNAPQPGSLLKGHDIEDNSDKDSISYDIYGETSQPPPLQRNTKTWETGWQGSNKQQVDLIELDRCTFCQKHGLLVCKWYWNSTAFRQFISVHHDTDLTWGGGRHLDIWWHFIFHGPRGPILCISNTDGKGHHFDQMKVGRGQTINFSSKSLLSNRFEAPAPIALKPPQHLPWAALLTWRHAWG